MSGSRSPGNLNDLTNVDAGSPNNNDTLTYQSASGKWEAVAGGGGGGETNTASNVNVGGTGVFKQKTGVDLEFRGINAGDSSISVALDAGNNEIDISVGTVNVDDLNDVVITTPADNEVLAYNTGTSTWINQTAAEAGLAAASHTHTLADITDSGSLAAQSTVNDGDWSGTDLAVANGGTGASTAGDARTNLGLAIGTDVQAYDADLAAIAALATTDGNFIVGNGSTWVVESGATALASIGGAAASHTHTLTDITDSGTLAGQNTVNDSDWSGTDLAVVNGGTGASTAAAARTNLGLAIGTDVQAYDAGLADIAGLAVTDGNVIVGDGANWVAESGATARASLGLAIGTDVQAYDNDLGDIAALTHTKGNIMVSNGTDWINVGVGTNDQVLTADSAQTAGVKWAAAGGGGGGLVHLETITASSSATIDFDSGNIDSTYSSYMIIATNVIADAANRSLYIRTSTDGGSTWDSGASDYQWCNVARGSDAGFDAPEDTADDEIELINPSIGMDSTKASNFWIKFNGPDASLACSFVWQAAIDGSGRFSSVTGAGQRVATADVDAVRLLSNSGNITSGEFRLYGIVDS